MSGGWGLKEETAGSYPYHSSRGNGYDENQALFFQVVSVKQEAVGGTAQAVADRNSRTSGGDKCQFGLKK